MNEPTNKMRQHYLSGSETCVVKTTEDKMSSRRRINIEALSERLGSLQINKEASTNEYKQMDTEMSTAVSENVQAGLPKNIVPDPG